jgi:hypothetical protein
VNVCKTASYAPSGLHQLAEPKEVGGGALVRLGQSQREPNRNRFADQNIGPWLLFPHLGATQQPNEHARKGLKKRASSENTKIAHMKNDETKLSAEHW